MFSSVMDQIKRRGIRENELPPNLIDRSMFFNYYTSIIASDYSDKTTLEHVYSHLIVLNDEWIIRSEENNIKQVAWNEEIDSTLCALGMCVIFELFQFKTAFIPKTINEITVPKNFDTNAYIKAINTIFSNANDDSSKRRFLSIIHEGNVSKKKLLHILISCNITDYREKRINFIKKVSSIILPKPEIKIIYTNSNLTANMANMNIDNHQVQSNAVATASSSSRANDLNLNIQKLLEIEDNNFGEVNSYDEEDDLEDEEDGEDDDDDFINYGKKTTVKESKIINKRFSSSAIAAQSKEPNKLIGKILVDSTSNNYQTSHTTITSKSKQKSINDVITNLSQAQSKINDYGVKDPLHDITNGKRPASNMTGSIPINNNSNKKSGNNGGKSKGPNNSSTSKRPKLIETRPDASKVAFDSDISDESDDDENAANMKTASKQAKYGIDTSKLSILNFPESKHSNASRLRDLQASLRDAEVNYKIPPPAAVPKGSSKFPKSLKDAAEVSPRSNTHKKDKPKSKTTPSGGRNFWTFDEEEALKAGIRKHGVGNWVTILRDDEFGITLSGRTGMNLKDKYKNLIKKNSNFSA